MSDVVYATLPQLKGIRRIAEDDTSDDVDLNRKLLAASRAIDRKTHRRFWLDETASARTYNPCGRRVLRDADGERLLVDDIGSPAGLLVEVGSWDLWSAVTDYEIEPDNAVAEGWAITALLRPHSWWAAGSRRVRVTAQWGWPSVPADIEEATILLANRLHLRRDTPEGLAASGEWGALRMSRWDPDVEALVAPFALG